MNNNNTKRVRADVSIRAYRETHEKILDASRECGLPVAKLVDIAMVEFFKSDTYKKLKKMMGG